MIATIGHIVHYALSANDCESIRRRRVADPGSRKWPAGAQAHVGNPPLPGDKCPMLLVYVWSNGEVNGQVFLDGNDVLWVTHIHEGSYNGTWCWPERGVG